APGEACFVLALAASGHGGRVFDSRRHFQSMVADFDLEPRKQHYSCMVDALARAGYLDDAMELLENMPYRPDTVDSMCFLAACRSH
ncbi:hypothetical protein SELMODRAFT_18349, partial [Selaginella moellendorffii]